MAIATATQIVLGYLIGARRLNDIQKRVNATLKVAIAACVGMAVLMCLGGKYIFLIFTDNPEIIALGRRILVIEIVLEIGRAVNIVMTKCPIAVGDKPDPDHGRNHLPVGRSCRRLPGCSAAKLGWGWKASGLQWQPMNACADSFTRCILRKNVGRRILRA